MRLAADTNVLIRAAVADDPKQARLAQSTLEKAELIAVTPTTLCEFVWCSRADTAFQPKISPRQFGGSSPAQTSRRTGPWSRQG